VVEVPPVVAVEPVGPVTTGSTTGGSDFSFEFPIAYPIPPAIIRARTASRLIPTLFTGAV